MVFHPSHPLLPFSTKPHFQSAPTTTKTNVKAFLHQPSPTSTSQRPNQTTLPTLFLHLLNSVPERGSRLGSQFFRVPTKVLSISELPARSLDLDILLICQTCGRLFRTFLYRSKERATPTNQSVLFQGQDSSLLDGRSFASRGAQSSPRSRQICHALLLHIDWTFPLTHPKVSKIFSMHRAQTCQVHRLLYHLLLIYLIFIIIFRSTFSPTQNNLLQTQTNKCQFTYL